MVTEQSPAEVYPATRRTLWPVLLLFCAAVLYNVDRLSVGVLAEPIHLELRISDFQMGLLLGAAFSALSSTFGLVVGYLVDRSVRRTVLGLCIILWSSATLASGLAPDFGALFICRALVGLGETALAPVALSLIADLFPLERRGRALSVYFLGATCGSSLAALIPGAVAAHALHMSLPGFGVLTAWRTTLVLCGLSGPLLGLLFFTVREPDRHGVRLEAGNRSEVGARLAYLWRHRPVIGPFVGGGLFYYLALSANISWTATFMMRAYHLTLVQIAGPLGLMTFLAGAAGYLLAGMLVDSGFVRRHGGKSALLIWVPLLALPAPLAVFCPGPYIALLALSAFTMATPLLNVASNASMQDLMPNAMRGFAITLFGAVGGLLAVSIGPLLVALVNEKVFGHDALIGYALAIVEIPMLCLSALCFAASRRALRMALTQGGELARIVASSR